MDLDNDLLAAIGRVVIEATNLESILAGLIVTRWGWDERQVAAMEASSGTVRRNLSRLAATDQGWAGICDLEQRASALLERRNTVVHSVVVHVHDEDEDEDEEPCDIAMWNARRGTYNSLPTVSELTQLASDLSGCAVGAVMSLHEAEARFERLGDAGAPKPRKVSGDGLITA